MALIFAKSLQQIVTLPEQGHPSRTRNHCTLLKWDKTKAENIDFTDIWIEKEAQNQIHKSTNALYLYLESLFSVKAENKVAGVKLESDM